MPAGRTIIQRTAGAIGTAVPARPAALRDLDRVARGGLRRIERRDRHCPRYGYRGKAKPDCEGRCSEDLHERSFPVVTPFDARERTTNPDYANIVPSRLLAGITSNAGANGGDGASGGASPNDVCASPSAGGDASPSDGGGASPSDGGPSPGGGRVRGPSALLRA